MTEPIDAEMAAARHKSVRAVCACGHKVVFNGDGLWWHCHSRGLPFEFTKLRLHLYCKRCWHGRCTRVSPVRIEACDEPPDTWLPQPPDDEARRAAKRLR